MSETKVDKNGKGRQLWTEKRRRKKHAYVKNVHCYLNKPITSVDVDKRTTKSIIFTRNYPFPLLTDVDLKQSYPSK